MQGLGKPPGQLDMSWAYGTSANGKRPPSGLLEEHGIGGAEGWHLSSAIGVSADGRSFAGTGVNRVGLPEAFLVVLP